MFGPGEEEFLGGPGELATLTCDVAAASLESLDILLIVMIASGGVFSSTLLRLAEFLSTVDVFSGSRSSLSRFKLQQKFIN